MNLTVNNTMNVSNNFTFRPSHSLWYQSAYNIVFILILVMSVFGQILLLIQLGRARKKKNILNILITHMALMDLILVLSSIPANLINKAYQSWKFGEVGCKLVYPLATYADISKILTLLAIAYQTWFGITNKTLLEHSKQKLNILLLVINAISISAVIPYTVNLSYSKDQATGQASCNEKWTQTHRKTYTIALFLLRYGIPAPLMVLFYYLSWRCIFESNKTLRKIFKASPSAGVTSNATTKIKKISYGSIKAMVFRLFCKKTDKHSFGITAFKGQNTHYLDRCSVKPASFQQRVLISRQIQYENLVRMFTLIVLVFLIFTLPNQLLGLYIDFYSDGSFNYDVFSISYIITFANCVLNPWIYGQWYRKIKKSYIFRVCFGRQETNQNITLESYNMSSN